SRRWPVYEGSPSAGHGSFLDGLSIWRAVSVVRCRWSSKGAAKQVKGVGIGIFATRNDFWRWYFLVAALLAVTGLGLLVSINIIVINAFVRPLELNFRASGAKFNPMMTAENAVVVEIAKYYDICRSSFDRFAHFFSDNSWSDNLVGYFRGIGINEPRYSVLWRSLHHGS